MKKKILLLVGMISLFLSCNGIEPNSTIELIIRGKFQDKPLIFAPGIKYLYFDGSNISFTRSEFFLSNIELITSKNELIPIGNVYFCELQNHHITLEKAEEGFKISIPVHHTGQFSGLRIGLGLSSDLNNTKPSDYNLGNILHDGEHYWAGWNSYVFSKTEGELSNKSKSVLFAYHTGFNEAYTTIDLMKPITLVQDQKATFDITVDHSKLFGSSSDYVNIYENNIVHNGLDFMIKFMNQFKNCIY